MPADYDAVRSAAIEAARRAQAEGKPSFESVVDTINALCADLPDAQRYEWLGRISMDVSGEGLNQPRMN